MTTHIFESAEVDRFAGLCGDFNPLHCDAIAARRRLGGRQLVHGMFVTMWALDECIARDGPRRLVRIQATFSSPIAVGAKVQCNLDSPGRISVMEITDSSIPPVLRFEIDFDIVDDPARDHLPTIPPVPRLAPECVDQDFGAAAIGQGELALYLDPLGFEEMFPKLAGCIPSHQAAALLGATRLVGMECPGKNSLFQGFEMTFQAAPAGDASIFYRVKKSDPRFFRIVLALESDWMSATLNTFCPPPRVQPSYADMQALVAAGEFSGIRALVIGGSRGIGEVATKLLAAGGADTRMTYHLGAEDAARRVNEIRDGGGSCASFCLDVDSSPSSLREALDSGLGRWAPDLCVYMATPRIDMEPRREFSSTLSSRYLRFYVEAFEALVRCLLDRSENSLKILYPSTIALEHPTSWSLEYAAAKDAGEALCRRLEASETRLRIATPRLPRLETDQTATLFPTKTPEIGPLVLECLREACRMEI